VRYEREKIWPNGDRPVFSDIYAPDYRLTIEAAGGQHRANRKHDQGRALWLARRFGVGTIRFRNSDILNGKAEADLAQRFGWCRDGDAGYGGVSWRDLHRKRF